MTTARKLVKNIFVAAQVPTPLRCALGVRAVWRAVLPSFNGEH